eukprot:COSAG01_NODE_510_length_16076_cov_102.088252_12_plen_387_part_00
MAGAWYTPFEPYASVRRSPEFEEVDAAAVAPADEADAAGESACLGLPVHSAETRARAVLLVNWVNSLALRTARGEQVVVCDVGRDLRDGSVVAALVRHFAGPTLLRGVQERAVSTRARAHNLEEALNVLRRKDPGATARLYDVQGVLCGRVGPTLAMLESALRAFVIRPQLQSSRLVPWARAALAPYGRDLDPTLAQISRELSDGVVVLCLLHAHVPDRRLRHDQQQHRSPPPRPDLGRVYWEPRSAAEQRENVSYALRMLAAHGVPCVFTVGSWCTRFPARPSGPCLLLLLHELCERYRDERGGGCRAGGGGQWGGVEGRRAHRAVGGGGRSGGAQPRPGGGRKTGEAAAVPLRAGRAPAAVAAAQPRTLAAAAAGRWWRWWRRR